MVVYRTQYAASASIFSDVTNDPSASASTCDRLLELELRLYSLLDLVLRLGDLTDDFIHYLIYINYDLETTAF